MNTSTMTIVVKAAPHPEPEFHWLGDNIGVGDSLIVRAKCAAGLVDFSLEEALRKIDQFAEMGRNRILLTLACHFSFDMGQHERYRNHCRGA